MKLEEELVPMRRQLKSYQELPPVCMNVLFSAGLGFIQRSCPKCVSMHLRHGIMSCNCCSQQLKLAGLTVAQRQSD